MPKVKPIYRVRALPKQQLDLDRSKHLHQLLQFEELKVEKMVTWLLASEGLLGSVYVFLKSQVAASEAQNRVASYQTARTFIELLTYAGVAVSISLILAIYSTVAAQSDLRRKHAKDSFLRSRAWALWPLAAIAMASLFASAWLVAAAKQA